MAREEGVSVDRSAGLAAHTGACFDRDFHFDARIDCGGGRNRRADERLAARGDRIAEVLTNCDEGVGSVECRFTTDADVLDELGQACFQGCR